MYETTWYFKHSDKITGMKTEKKKNFKQLYI